MTTQALGGSRAGARGRVTLPVRHAAPAFVGFRALPHRAAGPQAFVPAASPHAPGRGRLVIRAARVAGVEIPNAKRLETALTYIFGIGPTTAKAILAETARRGVGPLLRALTPPAQKMENKRTRELSEEELTIVREEVGKYQCEGDLRRFNLLAIKRLTDIQCYRGKRHRAGLPVRGQNTKRNARTRKGKKVTVAGKKKLTR